MADWDTSNPDDNDIVSQYPSNERAARTAVVANFGVDHHEANDADVGKHEVIQILDNAGSPTIDSGQIGIWNDGGTLKTRVGSGSVNQLARLTDVSGVAFVSGTRMLFHQSAAPTGWTQATNVNDRVLRVVSGGTGGDTGGSWTISGLTISNHTLTMSQIPGHDHGGTRTTSTDTHNHSGSTSYNGVHEHQMRGWRISGGNREDSSNSTEVLFGGRISNRGWGTTGSYNNAGNHKHTFGTSTDWHNHTVTILQEGGGGGHNHGYSHNGSWRPSYTDVIVGVKD